MTACTYRPHCPHDGPHDGHKCRGATATMLQRANPTMPTIGKERIRRSLNEQLRRRSQMPKSKCKKTQSSFSFEREACGAFYLSPVLRRLCYHMMSTAAPREFTDLNSGILSMILPYPKQILLCNYRKIRTAGPSYTPSNSLQHQIDATRGRASNISFQAVHKAYTNQQAS